MPPSAFVGLLCKTFFWLVGLIPYQGKKGRTDYSRYIGAGDLNPGRILADIVNCGTVTYSMMGMEAIDFASPLDGSFKKPALLMHGMRDTIISYRQTMALKELLPGARIRLLKANHVAVINNAADVNKILAEFLAQHKA